MSLVTQWNKKSRQVSPLVTKPVSRSMKRTPFPLYWMMACTMTRVSSSSSVFLASTFVSSPQSSRLFYHHNRKNKTPCTLRFMNIFDDTNIEKSVNENDVPPIAFAERNLVLSVSRDLATDSTTGIFLSGSHSRDRLERAIVRLEAAVPIPPQRSDDIALGDWELVCTSNKVPFGREGGRRGNKKKSLPNLLPDLTASLRDSLKVIQRVRCNAGGVTDRIDNVIEFTPPSDLSNIVPEDSPLPFAGILRGFDVNPLGIGQTSIVLVHDAEVESVRPVFRTKIGLRSVVGE